MTETKILIKSYGWQELAILYSPELIPRSAVKRLSRWVAFNPKLEQELIETGWYKGKKVLTPGQVAILFRYLGEPG